MHYTCSRFRVESLFLFPSLVLPCPVALSLIPRSTEDLRRRDSRSDDSSGEFASLESATWVAATLCDHVWQSSSPPSLPSSRPFHWCFRRHRYEFHVALRTLTDYCHGLTSPRCAQSIPETYNNREGNNPCASSDWECNLR